MYPNSNSPYPPYQQGAGYPPVQPPPYPPQQGAAVAPPPYPPQQQGYPSAAAGFNQTPGYPPAAPVGYPPSTAGYPTGGFGAGYPPSQFGAPNPNQASPYPAAAPHQQQFQQQSAYPTAGAPVHGYPAVSTPHQPQYGHGQPGGGNMNLQPYPEVPSIVATHSDPNSDAQVLRKAMKGFGTDEKAIIAVLTRRTDAQRQAICQAFKASFGKDLIKDLEKELGDKLEDVILALMTPRIQYLAQMVRKAISGVGTKESLLVDILCTSTNHEIRQIGAAYEQMFGVPMERDLKGDTSGHFMRLLVSICAGGRSEDPHVNQALAAEDAQKLHSAGVKQWGTDESMFNMILATRSYPQLRAVFQEYERISGHSFEQAIQREFSGDVETGMLAIVRSAKNRAAYFAQRLHDSMAGAGTKDNDLIFIMVSRADIDLGSVAEEYHKMYNKSLASAISGDTSGDYKKVLLGILGM